MKRVAIFAHYDKNNKIQDFVIYYLKELRKAFEFIVFVSDSNLTAEEIEKINNYVNVVIAQNHGKYDFGSYQIGYNYLVNNNLLSVYDELALINDSCYGPLFDLINVFEKMDSYNVDFWGLSANYSSIKHKKYHVQSFFIVFRKNVFLSSTFTNFIYSIKKEKNKMDIVLNYELGLTSKLENANFKWEVFSEISKNSWDSYLYDYKKLIKDEHFPLLKRSIVLGREALFVPAKKIINMIIQNTSYPVEYIEQDFKANVSKFRIKTHCFKLSTYIIKFTKRIYWYLYEKVLMNCHNNKK